MRHKGEEEGGRGRERERLTDGEKKNCSRERKERG